MNSRWTALAVIFFSFVQFTLNWFDVVPTFSGVATEMHLTPAQIGMIVGLFIAGYGVAHIPGGMIAEAFGLRFAMLLGIAIETGGAVVSAQAGGYEVLLVGRFLCGIGGSIYLGSAIGLTAAWFRNNELATANGLITGVAFTVGAVLGLHGWSPLVADYGWRTALSLGAAFGVATFIVLLFLFPEPPPAEREQIGAHHLNLASLKRTFGNRNLWMLGITFSGGYGSYFTAAQLLPAFAAEHLQLTPDIAATIAALLLVSGMVGGILGGWLADKVFGPTTTMTGAFIVESIALLLVPHLGLAGLMVAAAVIGASAILGFVVWIGFPGLYRSEIEVADIPTAAGLMLTIVAIGGVVVPTLYGKLVEAFGYLHAWTFLGLATLVATCACLAVRKPESAHVAGRQQTDVIFK
ncbi:MFS transporter [Trinickia sp. NRRL B-1857]|uniref:MFS transporter n=1 Tax=Trinickia sp. NRRL B-1857 TaxID=3162879 RepID=UPI003D2C9E71